MSSWVRQAVTAAALATTVGTAVPAFAAVDVFIKIAEIKGETTDSKHKGEIDALSWSWGTSQSAATAGGRAPMAGKATGKELVFTKIVDSTSPLFVQYVNTGKILPEVHLTVRQAGGKGVEYIRLKLKDVLVSSVKMGGSQGVANPTEEIALSYAAIEYSVAPITSAGGAGAAVVTTFNFATNKP